MAAANRCAKEIQGMNDKAAGILKLSYVMQLADQA
jgi:hypothetical protein